MEVQQRSMVRALIRDCLVGVAVILTLPLWLLDWVERGVSGGEGFFKSCSESLSLIPGKAGIFLRRGFYRMTLDRFATDCSIGFGTTVAHREVRIDRGVYIGNRSTLGKAIIAADVAIGSNVDILSGRRQHHFASLDEPIQEQGGTFEQIRIGHNSWIGNSAVVMADIGDDCVIGAGSVVVKPIPARSVAVGNPATVKNRREPAASATAPLVH
jgi:acetyltransferase-like isoleucine patch superfamily enzyme